MIGNQLKTEIEDYATSQLTENPLLQLARAGRASPELVVTYVANLRYLLRSTIACLELGRRCAIDRGDHALAEHYTHKIREEIGHDEWAANDLGALSARLGVCPPEGILASLRGLLDYLEESIREEPASYLAYMLLAEYFTVLVGPEWLRLLEAHCGIPTSHLTAVGKHIELDKEHAAEGVREIDALVSGDQAIERLRRTLRGSMQHLDRFCRELGETVH